MWQQKAETSNGWLAATSLAPFARKQQGGGRGTGGRAGQIKGAQKGQTLTGWIL